MMNNFMNTCADGNSCLWILLILLVVCNCGGFVDDIFDKLCNCETLLPLLLVLLCCSKGGTGTGFGGCGCGK